MEEEQNLKSLAKALHMFLMELDEYRSTCIAHDPTTEVIVGRNGSLWLKKKYKSSPELQDIAQRVLNAMESWKESPWGDLDMWEEIRKRAVRDAKPEICKGVSENGFPVMLMATFGKKDTVVSSMSPPITQPWQPDFLPRKLSVALGCHQRLVPEVIAKPVAMKRRRDGCYPIHALLKKTAEKEGGEALSAILHGWTKNRAK